MTDIGERVAEHYNNLAEKGLAERRNSRIFYLRNFNNWIKSMLISDILQQVKKESNQPISVLDIGCGKGGDLLKWKKGGIHHLVCADIAQTSVEQCEQRFQDMLHRQQYQRKEQEMFDAEFITADCTKDRLSQLYKDRAVKFDVTSCQFAFHYCFESFRQVNQMLQNASECLRKGGYFIGTMPDSYELIRRLKSADGSSYGNAVYQVSFENKTALSLFGMKYNFHLEEVVDCPEFLVHFPMLVELAHQHGLELMFKKHFDAYYAECIESPEKARKQEARQLLGKMQALETYPSFDGETVGTKDDYLHAKQQNEQFVDGHHGGSRISRVGTLSQAEWEVITLYVVFAFKKIQE